MLTDVEGILGKDGRLIPRISVPETAKLKEEGVLTGGMIPKVDCCVSALQAGVEKATIVDGRVENCVLLELLTDRGIGTQLEQ